MDDDQIFDSVLGAQTAATATAVKPASAPASMSDDEIFDSVIGSEDKPKTTGGGTPDNPFSAVITFSQKLQQAREVGQMGFREAAMGHAVMSGEFTFEEVEQQISADDRMGQLSGDLEQYEKDSAVPWLTGIALSTAKQLPMIEQSLVPMAAGTAVGTGAIASTGVGLPVSIPVGLATGTAAVAGWSMDFITGQEYLEMRRRGLDHDVASVAAPVSGFVQGMLGGLQFGSIGKLAINTARNTIAAHAKTIAQFLAEGAWFGFEQMSLSEAQTATKLIGEAVAGTVSKTPGAIPTVEEAVKEFANTFNETLKSSIGLFAGGKVVGKASGLTLKALLKKGVNAHEAKQKSKLEAIAKAQEKDQQGSEDSSGDREGGADTGEATDKEVSKSRKERERRAAERREKFEASLNEIKRIFLAAQSKFFIETSETKMQEAKRIQRLLKRLVMNSDKIQDNVKTKLLARIVEIDSVADLLREGGRFVEDLRWSEYRKDLEKAHNRLEKAIESGQHKGKKGALPPEAQQSLKWYDEFFSVDESVEYVKGGDSKQELMRQAALKKATDFIERGIEEEKTRINEQIEKLENNELAQIFEQPADLAEKRKIAMEAQQFFSRVLGAEDINNLASEIESIVETGKSEFKQRKEAEAAKMLEARAKITEAVQGIKPVTPSTAGAPKQMKPLGKLLNSIRRTSTALWDKMLQDTPFDEREKIISDLLDFTEVENREATLNIKAAEKLTELYVKAVGNMREVTRLIRDGANKKDRIELKYSDADGGTGLEKHTLNELVYLHLALQDPGAVSGLVAGNKYTLEGMVEAGSVSTQEAVRDILAQREGGKYLKLAEAIQDFYRWMAPQISNHYLKEYGVKMPLSENYSGQIFHRQVERLQKSAGDILDAVHQGAQRTLDPSSTKARSNSRLPIKLVDPFDQVQRHRADMAFWMANSEKARLLSFIFSDSSKDGLRDVISHKLGEEFKGLVDARLSWQFHLKPGLMDIADSTYQGVKGNLATGFLGGRPDQFFKQLTGILAPLHTCTVPEYLDGLRSIANIKEYISRSELYRDRQDHILNALNETTTERSLLDKLPGMLGDNTFRIKQGGMIFMHLGDGVGGAVSGFIEYNRIRKKGGTIEEAVLAGDRLIDRTQSSSRASQKVPSEFKGGLANISLAFAKESIQALNRESGAIRDYLIHKDEKSLQRMARTIVSIHLAQTLFQAMAVGIPAALAGDEDEQKDAGLRIAGTAIFGSYSQIPLVGIDIAFGALSGWKGQQEPRTILGNLASEQSKLVKRVWKIGVKFSEGEEVDSGDWMSLVKSVISIGGTYTGLPLWGPYKYLELGDKLGKKMVGEE